MSQGCHSDFVVSRASKAQESSGNGGTQQSSGDTERREPQKGWKHGRAQINCGGTVARNLLQLAELVANRVAAASACAPPLSHGCSPPHDGNKMQRPRRGKEAMKARSVIDLRLDSTCENRCVLSRCTLRQTKPNAHSLNVSRSSVMKLEASQN